jgi:hypothetical protein
MQDFLPQLKDHLLLRLLGRPYQGDEVTFSDMERQTVTFVNNQLYRHKAIRINYTTYDVRRSQDSLNPRTHADIMVLSHEDEEDPHPYWYGRILGAFHALVRHVGPDSVSTDVRRMDFLWIRWFGRDLGHRAGWAAKRLHRLGFMDSEDPGAFGFLDPKEVIRGVHLMPAFAFGRTSELLAPSIARQPREKDKDWRFYYINSYAAILFHIQLSSPHLTSPIASLTATCSCDIWVVALDINHQEAKPNLSNPMTRMISKLISNARLLFKEMPL